MEELGCEFVAWFKFLSPLYEFVKWHARAFCACTVSVHPVADWLARDESAILNVAMNKISCDYIYCASLYRWPRSLWTWFHVCVSASHMVGRPFYWVLCICTRFHLYVSVSHSDGRSSCVVCVCMWSIPYDRSSFLLCCVLCVLCASVSHSDSPFFLCVCCYDCLLSWIDCFFYSVYVVCRTFLKERLNPT